MKLKIKLKLNINLGIITSSNIIERFVLESKSYQIAIVGRWQIICYLDA